MKRFSLFFALFLSLVSCQSASQESKRQVLRVNIRSEPSTLDPRKARELTTVILIHTLFEGLMRTGRDGKAEPALAEKIEISEGGRRYRFQLRKAFWSNGDPVTSHDFAASWKKVLDPAFPSDTAYQLFVIQGAKQAKLGEASLDQVGIATPDLETLIVDLEKPTPYFFELLTFPAFFPVNQRLDAENPQWMEDPTGYVSNGPFILCNWKHGDQMRLKRNPTYWDAEKVQLQELDLLMTTSETELRLFLDGKLDWAGSPLSMLPVDALKKLKLERSLAIESLTGTVFLRVNLETKAAPLADPLFRRALAAAIHRKEIVEHIMQGGQLPAKALVPPRMGLSEEGYFADGDSETAQACLHAYLEKAGIQKSNLLPLTLSFVAGERNLQLVQGLQQQIESNLGIRIALEAVELKSLFERISKKEYQLALGSWIADFNDPINFLEVFKYKNGGTNNTGWEDPKYIELLDLSAVCESQAERKHLLQQAERILMDQMPFIPLYHCAMGFVKRENVKDVCISPIGQIDFRWSHVEEENAQ